MYLQKIGVYLFSLVLLLPLAFFHLEANGTPYFSYQKYEKSEKWLDGPVKLIIIDEEKKLYKQMRTEEEKALFKRWFWARRDPYPKTPWNEFQEEIERRIYYCINNFKEKGLEGWETARGQIYLVLGSPERMWEELIPGRGSTPAILWLYDQFPSVLLDPMKPLVFVDVYRNGHYHLVSYNTQFIHFRIRRSSRLPQIPSRFLSILKEANERTIFDPDLTLEDIKARETNLKSSEELGTPFQWRVDSEPISFNTVRLHISVAILYRNISFYQEGSIYKASLQLTAKLFQESGELVDELQNEIKIELTLDELNTKANEKLEYRGSLTAPPGEYDIEIVLKDKRTDIVKTAKRKLKVVSDQ